MASVQSKRMIAIGLIVAAGVGMLLAGTQSLARTSSTTYCTSCHEMASHKTELERSSHVVDKDKQPIECSQCHIPQGFGPKYLTVKITSGIRDLWVHRFGDPENPDRRRLQNAARRFIVDENCRTCHADLFKTTKGEPLSRIGQLSHAAYLGENGTTRRGCRMPFQHGASARIRSTLPLSRSQHRGDGEKVRPRAELQRMPSILTEIDLERMEQVAVNLIENAIRFSRDGGRIDIETRIEGDRVHLAIKDHGIGIDRDDLQRVFEKFHTLPSGAGNRDGTGLSLTICRRIVQAHDGEIWAESEARMGSTFHVSLPHRSQDKSTSFAPAVSNI